MSKKGKKSHKKSKSHRYDSMRSDTSQPGDELANAASTSSSNGSLLESSSSSTKNPKKERAKKWLLTCLFGLANFGTGASTVVIGMILLDLQFLTGITSSDTAWLFTTKAIGLLIGIAVTGCSQSCLHVHILVMSWLFAASLIVLPFCPNLISLVVAFLAMGISYVSIYSVGTICMAALWKQKRSSCLYFITACGYLGYFISPVASYPFTTDYYANWTTNITNISHVGKAEWRDVIKPNTTETIGDEVQRKLVTLLAVVGGIVAVSGTLITLIVCCLGQDTFRMPEVVEDDSSDEEDMKRPSTGVVVFFIMVGACVQVVGDGQKLSLAESYLKTFLSRHMQLTRLRGIIAVTIFTGAHVVWAILGKLIQKKTGASVPFLIMVVFNTTGGAVLMACGQSFTLFCVGCALIGVGLSAKSACLVCWVKSVIGNEEFIIYTSYMSWAVGDILFSNLIGHLIDDNPYSFIHITFGGSIAMLVAFFMGHIGYVVVFKDKGQSLVDCLTPLFVKEKV